MNPLIGCLYVAGASALWASAGLVGAFSGDLPPAVLAELRALFGSIAFAVFLGPSAFRGINPHVLWRPVLAASTFLAIYQWSFFAAVESTNASAASIISTALAPFFADIIEQFKDHKAPSKWWAICAGIALVGILPLYVTKGVSASGLTTSIFAAASYALYTSEVAKLQQGAELGLAATAIAFFIAAVVLLPAANSQIPSSFSATTLFSALYLGVVTTAIAYAMFVRSLRYLAAPMALNIALLQPLATILLDALVLDVCAGHGT